MKLELERELEETKVNRHPAVNTEQSQQRVTRLPKLEITKLKGTYEGWLPFWNKFQAEIDKTNLASVTKFAYLKELVDPKVQTDMDGLPFTTEGYERAKNILVSEYGKTSEIVNAYAQNIMNLPVITGTQPANIHKFLQEACVQCPISGDTGEIDGHVRKYKECAQQAEENKGGFS